MSVGARGLQRGGTSREAALVNSSLAQPPPRMDRSRRRTGAPSPSGNGQRAFEERQRRRTLAARASHENGRAGREREGKGARARVLRLIRKTKCAWGSREERQALAVGVARQEGTTSAGLSGPARRERGRGGEGTSLGSNLRNCCFAICLDWP